MCAVEVVYESFFGGMMFEKRFSAQEPQRLNRVHNGMGGSFSTPDTH